MYAFFIENCMKGGYFAHIKGKYLLKNINLIIKVENVQMVYYKKSLEKAVACYR
jgi:hypothetical protein